MYKDIFITESLEDFEHKLQSKDKLIIRWNASTNYTNKEEGVRNLKRCLETIISKINIYYLSYNEESDSKKNEINMTFKIDNFQLPIIITNEIVKELLSVKKTEGPPEHMYM